MIANLLQHSFLCILKPGSDLRIHEAEKSFIYTMVAFIILVNTLIDKADAQHKGDVLAVSSKDLIYIIIKESSKIVPLII